MTNNHSFIIKNYTSSCILRLILQFIGMPGITRECGLLLNE